VQRAPGFPCALYFLRVKSCASLGHFMPRECGPMPSRRLKIEQEKIERENVASNAWPAEQIAKHENSPSSKRCWSKAGVDGFSSVSSTRGGQTMNPVTLVTPTIRLLPSKLSHDQQRAIGSDRSHSEVAMSTMTSPEKGRKEGQHAMNTPPIVSPQAWKAAHEQLLVKEKALTRARDALAAERRRMPWVAVEKAYTFDGPGGKASLLDLFEGRRQLIIYRAFFEPGVHGWPEHACIGCSLGADQVAQLAHLNARDTTLVYASRAPQADIARLKALMGWEIPWVSITDSFDADFGVDEWHGHNAFIRDGERVFRTYFINGRGDEAMGTTWSYLDMTALGRQETWEDSPEGYPQSRPYKWWNWHESYVPDTAPDPKWVEVSDAGEAAFRKRDG
jgi:predicted dithiol-disulfide oxidoreductase (DUF899 family)